MLSPSGFAESERAYAIVSRVVGGLLLVAAALKFFGSQAAPLAQIGPFASNSFVITVVELEICLAVWLLWGRLPAYAWFTSIAAFFIFALVSAYTGWLGNASCGCLGDVPASPWLMFALDLVTLTALGFARPDLRQRGSSAVVFLACAACSIGVVVTVIASLACIISAAGTAVFGSQEAALAALRGDSFYVRPGVLDVGRRTAGVRFSSSVEIVNRAGVPISIVGGSSDCACIVTDSLPCVIDAHSTGEISLTISMPPRPGSFAHRVTVWSDLPSQPKSGFRLTGICVEHDQD